MNQDECPVVSRKDGDGISDSFKRLGRRQAVPSITATSVPDAVCRVSCARSASASRDAHTHVPYCDTCLRLPRAQMSLHMDDTVGCQCTRCGPVRGSVCAVSARRCECQRQLQRALPVVHTCDSDYSHSTGEHVLVRDGTRRNGSSVGMACHHGIVVVQATGVPGTRWPDIVQFLADMHRHNVTSSH